MSSTAYEKITARAREIALIENTANVLQWDQETYLPRQANDYRGQQLAYLSGQSHRLFIAPEVGDWLKEAADGAPAMGSAEAANIARWQRRYERATCVPVEFVETLEREKSRGHATWVEARQKNDFSIFQPSLTRLLDYSRSLAEFWGYNGEPYDALLETYEPGATTAQLTTLFGELRPSLIALLNERRNQQRPLQRLDGHFPAAAQAAFVREVAEAIGYDFGAGRIDVTAHPFCSTSGPRDIRITTRYDESDFLSALYSVLHETGHALYEMGLPEDQFGLPSGSASSNGIHESQSRLWENHVGRSGTFWKRWTDDALAQFPDLADYSPDEITAATQSVQPSLIRVEADEMTYDLHIMLRFTLETALLRGELEVTGLPTAWNELFQKSLGLRVPDAARGCLQDIHWSFAGFGYFPTYTLGNLNASQLMATAEKKIPQLDDELTLGNYDPLLQWLRENVHRHGQTLHASEIMERATGETTNPKYHLEYLRAKYL
ncbi:MAG TPA: carboxypeptidase M32 [Chthoniobacterales bacterium]|jgi:carboxypeptidase Taq